MCSCLFVVDIQYGFISDNTKHILDPVNTLINSNIFDHIVATRFINEEDSPYRRFLKWNKLSSVEEIKLYEPVEKAANLIIDKNIYTALSAKMLDFIISNNINTVFIAGIDTDCCVLATSVDMFEHNIRPYVLEKYSASNGGIESHNAAIKVLQRLIGDESIIREIITKEQVSKLVY